MICLILTSMVVLSTLNSINHNNPVNISILLILSVTLIVLILFYSTNNAWFPIILYILFLGGILVIFLILSTISPNTNISNNNTNFLIITYLLALLGLITIHNSSNLQIINLSDMQWFLQSSNIIIIITISISIYFLIFTILISIENISLRTTL